MPTAFSAEVAAEYLEGFNRLSLGLLVLLSRRDHHVNTSFRCHKKQLHNNTSKKNILLSQGIILKHLIAFV